MFTLDKSTKIVLVVCMNKVNKKMTGCKRASKLERSYDILIIKIVKCVAICFGLLRSP